MKIIIMIIWLVLCSFSLVYADANDVQISSTSPVIVKNVCAIAGTVTFGFDAGSVIQEGDEWYFDLPAGATICNDMDYIITGGGAENCSGFVDISGGFDSAYLAGYIKGIASTPISPGSSAGPCSVVAAGGTSNTVATGNVFIRVYAQANSQRVGLYVYGDSPGANITVGSGTRFNITVFDGNAYGNYIVMDKGTGNLSGNGVYGDSVFDNCNCADTISDAGPGTNPPHIENIMGINVDESVSNNNIEGTFSSKNDKFSASPADFQVAEVISTPFGLQYCQDNPKWGSVKINYASCKFNYQTGAGYDPQASPAFSGNYFYIEASVPFGDAPGDHYDIIIKSLTPGVYFSGSPVLKGFTGDNGICDVSGGTEITADFQSYKDGGVTPADGYPDDSCIVAEGKRVREVRTNNGNITGINNYDRLRIELPDMVYDNELVSEGTEAKLQIILKKYNGADGVELLNDNDVKLADFTEITFPFKIPDTGQDKCYGGVYSTDSIPCPSEGEDWYGQDANYLINPPRYENIDYPNGIKAVRDNATGLIWEVKQNFDGMKDYSNPSDADNMYTWYDPDPDTNGGVAGYESENDTQDFLTLLRQKSGKNDWRLPNVHELMFLLDYKNHVPKMNTDFFPNNNTGYSNYWTATTVVSSTNNAWTVEFNRPNNVAMLYKSNKFAVRAVRGTEISLTGGGGRFTDIGDNTVIDNYTGLMWEQKTPSNKSDKLIWNSALSYCENLTLKGYDDWHLPNMNELLTLVDFKKSGPPFIDTDFFPNTYRDPGDGSSFYYWSSTPIAYPECKAFHMNFENGCGDFNNGDRRYNINCVRCVRYVKNETGDLNHDSKVDLKDAVVGLKVMAGMTDIEDVYPDTAIEGYKKIGLENTIYILQYVSWHR